MKVNYSTLLALVLLFNSEFAFSEIYKCKLPSGKNEYQSAPCKNGEEISRKLNNSKPIDCKDEDGKNCIKLTFRSIEVRQILQVLADFSENKLVLDDNVKGSGTFVYTNQPWKKVLKDIASKYNLVATINNGTINVKPK